MAEVIKRGQVVCLPKQTVIVPEPALALLAELGEKYDNLGEEHWDHIVRVLHSSRMDAA